MQTGALSAYSQKEGNAKERKVLLLFTVCPMDLSQGLPASKNVFYVSHLYLIRKSPLFKGVAEPTGLQNCMALWPPFLVLGMD